MAAIYKEEVIKLDVSHAMCGQSDDNFVPVMHEYQLSLGAARLSTKCWCPYTKTLVSLDGIKPIDGSVLQYGNHFLNKGNFIRFNGYREYYDNIMPRSACAVWKVYVNFSPYDPKHVVCYCIHKCSGEDKPDNVGSVSLSFTMDGHAQTHFVHLANTIVKNLRNRCSGKCYVQDLHNPHYFQWYLYSTKDWVNGTFDSPMNSANTFTLYKGVKQIGIGILTGLIRTGLPVCTGGCIWSFSDNSNARLQGLPDLPEYNGLGNQSNYNHVVSSRALNALLNAGLPAEFQSVLDRIARMIVADAVSQNADTLPDSVVHSIADSLKKRNFEAISSKLEVKKESDQISDRQKN